MSRAEVSPRATSAASSAGAGRTTWTTAVTRWVEGLVP
jgi:hypothetical protein